jgi:PAS domain S-box-containing protein
MRIHTYVKKQMPETAEEKRNAEQLLLCATIIESSKDIILSVDTDGIITSWNKGAEKIFGYASCEIIGMHISVLIPQYLRLQESEIMERILTGKKKLSHYETERIKKDGRFITVSLTISPIMDTGGKIIGASKISTDITERKRLQKKQALFASLVDSCDDAIISKDLNDMITSWNFGAEKAFGYKAGEVIGRHISILLPPRLQNDEMEIMGRVSKGETISHYETERIDKKGGTIYVSLTISPIRDELGTIIGTSKISRDISKRKKAEENLKRSESNIAAIMENTDAFIYSIDTDFRYTTFNPQLQKSMLDIYGLAIKLGDNVFGFLLEAAPDEAESWRHVYLEAFKGRSIHFVKEFQVGSFQSFMRFSVNPIWEEGEIIGLSCIAIDITQEKQSEAEIKSLNESLERKVRERTAELQNVNAELEAFSYTVSHDLQAPLRALSGFAKILLGDYTGHMNEQGLECLNFIDASANKMSELIKALLHFSQMGKGPLQKQ